MGETWEFQLVYLVDHFLLYMIFCILVFAVVHWLLLERIRQERIIGAEKEVLYLSLSSGLFASVVGINILEYLR